MNVTSVRVLPLLLLLALVVGCSGGDARYPLRGTVTVDGKPVERGTISFRPVDVNSGRGSGGFIENGQFEIAEKDGLAPGEYGVTILASEATGKTTKVDLGREVPEYMPIEFPETGNLKITVEPTSDNDFELKLSRATNSEGVSENRNGSG